MSSLNAMVLSQNGVRLDWVTISETNNYGFEVERAQGTQQNFQMLPNGFVPGHGTTIQPHQYSFTDLTAIAGSWSYRLAQIDLDGMAHYSEAVQVEVAKSAAAVALPTVFSLRQNYPNPFNPSTTIAIALPRDAKVSLAVYNTLGQKMAQLVDELMTAGNHSLMFDASRLASGVYFYRLQAGSFVQTKKLLLLR